LIPPSEKRLLEVSTITTRSFTLRASERESVLVSRGVG
jgi:hypothetical protein